jgi:uncharacterized membrane protein YbhN (UPF0104 family)
MLGLCAGIAVAGAMILYLGISQREVVQKLEHPLLWPLFFAAAGSLILLGLQSLRWWTVMRPVLRLSYFQAYRAMAVGFFFNTLLPARAGDLLRVQYLGKRTGVSRAKLLGTEIVDFCSDKWGWVASFPIVCLLGSPPAWLFRALLALSSTVVGVAALLALMGSPWWRTAPDGSPRGPTWLRNLRDGFAAQHWKRLLWVESLLAPLPWLWETMVIVVAGRALGLSLAPMEAFAVLTAFNLATVVTSPGNVGSFESGGTLALVQFHVPNSTALAFVFLYHLSQVLPSFAAGALVLAMEGEHLFGRRGVLRSPEPVNE